MRLAAMVSVATREGAASGAEPEEIVQRIDAVVCFILTFATLLVVSVVPVQVVVGVPWHVVHAEGAFAAAATFAAERGGGESEQGCSATNVVAAGATAGPGGSPWCDASGIAGASGGALGGLCRGTARFSARVFCTGTGSDG
ncbi:MAG TPA: hypothetical protein DIT89_12955 [Planctomycetaceae bacterium]|nr:hypothetical protein [Planctomycetaceae bacterium]